MQIRYPILIILFPINITCNMSNRTIPEVSASNAPRRPHPEYRGNNITADQRRIRQLEANLGRVEAAQQKNEEVIIRLLKENQELKAMFAAAPKDTDRHGFPGSDNELDGLRVSR